MNKWFRKTKERFWNCLKKETEATPEQPEQRELFCWLSPYSVGRSGTIADGWPIIFEDLVIMKVNLFRRADAETIVGALNGAYNLGRARERLDHNLESASRFLHSEQH